MFVFIVSFPRLRAMLHFASVRVSDRNYFLAQHQPESNLAAPSQQEGEKKHHQKNNKQDLRDARGCAGDAGEA
jgi:hypothetical protein